MLTKEEFGLSEFYPEYFPHLDNLGFAALFTDGAHLSRFYVRAG